MHRPRDPRAEERVEARGGTSRREREKELEREAAKEEEEEEEALSTPFSGASSLSPSAAASHSQLRGDLRGARTDADAMDVAKD